MLSVTSITEDKNGGHLGNSQNDIPDHYGDVVRHGRSPYFKTLSDTYVQSITFQLLSYIIKRQELYKQHMSEVYDEGGTSRYTKTMCGPCREGSHSLCTGPPCECAENGHQIV